MIDETHELYPTLRTLYESERAKVVCHANVYYRHVNRGSEAIFIRLEPTQDHVYPTGKRKPPFNGYYPCDYNEE